MYTSYPESIHVEESLVIQYIAYKELKLTDLEVATKKVIDHNYPNNKLALDVNEGTKNMVEILGKLSRLILTR